MMRVSGECRESVGSMIGECVGSMIGESVGSMIGESVGSDGDCEGGL